MTVSAARLAAPAVVSTPFSPAAHRTEAATALDGTPGVNIAKTHQHSQQTNVDKKEPRTPRRLHAPKRRVSGLAEYAMLYSIHQFPIPRMLSENRGLHLICIGQEGIGMILGMVEQVDLSTPFQGHHADK
ncbi:hypothetical protein Bbelb_320550 [Branchiostoma belcheri]|nr:hypothetical protein Bbelb_320550 [Branchiostoma belcheri]